MAQLSADKQAYFVSRMTPLLQQVARAGATIQYNDLMERVAGPGRGFIGGVLTEICQNEVAEGRPLLTAIVVKAGTLDPGPGYWQLPVAMERADDPAEQRRLARAEQARVWAYWRNH